MFEIYIKKTGGQIEYRGQVHGFKSERACWMSFSGSDELMVSIYGEPKTEYENLLGWKHPAVKWMGDVGFGLNAKIIDLRNDKKDSPSVFYLDDCHDLFDTLEEASLIGFKAYVLADNLYIGTFDDFKASILKHLEVRGVQ